MSEVVKAPNDLQPTKQEQHEVPQRIPRRYTCWARRSIASLALVGSLGGLGVGCIQASETSPQRPPAVMQTTEVTSAAERGINEDMGQAAREFSGGIVQYYMNTEPDQATNRPDRTYERQQGKTDDGTYDLRLRINSGPQSNGQHTQYELETSVGTRMDGMKEKFDPQKTDAVSIRVLDAGDSPQARTIYSFSLGRTIDASGAPAWETTISYGDKLEDAFLLTGLPGDSAVDKKDYGEHIQKARDVIAAAEGHSYTPSVQKPG